MILLSECLQNVYASPAAELLERRLNEADLEGRIKVTRMEITTYTNDEGAFIAALNARLGLALEDMAGEAPDALFLNWNWPT